MIYMMDGRQESYISDVEKQIKGKECTSTSKSFTINPPIKTGWVCPICGAGLAPWVQRCPCQDKWEVTC